LGIPGENPGLLERIAKAEEPITQVLGQGPGHQDTQGHKEEQGPETVQQRVERTVQQHEQ
jgi:hypothetical protein